MNHAPAPRLTCQAKKPQAPKTTIEQNCRRPNGRYIMQAERLNKAFRTRYEVMNMFCAKCGAAAKEGSKFCLNCGNPLSAEAPPANATPAATQQVQQEDSNKKKGAPKREVTIPTGISTGGINVRARKSARTSSPPPSKKVKATVAL